MDFFDFTLFTGTGLEFKIIRLVNFFLVLLFARFFWYVLRRGVLPRIYKRSKFDIGFQYAATQILKYIVYTIALLSAIQSLGINLTVIWGTGAALAVGFGLGIQQTFADLAAGIILLFEGSVEVGDILEVDGRFGKVKKIGVRTTKVETFDLVMLIIPNSKIIGDKVVNWSQQDEKVRFSITVGVAYGSDTKRVKELLLDVAERHSLVLNDPKPNVRFEDFGDSALLFELIYFSRELIRHKDVKSDLRFAIEKAFRTSKIEIPFPQRDVWMKTPGPS